MPVNAHPIESKQGQYPAYNANLISESVTPNLVLSSVWEKCLGVYQAVNGGWLFRPKLLKLAYKDGKLEISTRLLALLGWYDDDKLYLKPIDDETADVYQAGSKNWQRGAFSRYAKRFNQTVLFRL